MNRRNFLKAMLGVTAAVIVPGVIGKKVAEIGVDLAEPGTDKTVFGRIDGFRYVESPNEDDLLDAVVKAGEALDDAGIPKSDRFVAVWNEEMLKQFHKASVPMSYS